MEMRCFDVSIQEHEAFVGYIDLVVPSVSRFLPYNLIVVLLAISLLYFVSIGDQ